MEKLNTPGGVRVLFFQKHAINPKRAMFLPIFASVGDGYDVSCLDTSNLLCKWSNGHVAQGMFGLLTCNLPTTIGSHLAPAEAGFRGDTPGRGFSRTVWLIVAPTPFSSQPPVFKLKMAYCSNRHDAHRFRHISKGETARSLCWTAPPAEVECWLWGVYSARKFLPEATLSSRFIQMAR